MFRTLTPDLKGNFSMRFERHAVDAVNLVEVVDHGIQVYMTLSRQEFRLTKVNDVMAQTAHALEPY